MSATRDRVALVGLLLLLAVVGLMHRTHGPALGADDHGQYLMHGKALYEGRPYVDIGFIHTPYSTLVAPIAEPPGMPVLIAGTFALAGAQAEPVRLVLFIALALLAACVFAYARRLESAVVASLVAAWTVLAISRLHALDTVLADLPFCAAMWAAFLVADTPSLKGWRRVALLAATGALAFSFRMAALPLLPAAATALLVGDRSERRDWLVAGAAWTAAAALVLFALPAAEVLGKEVARSPAMVLADLQLNLQAIADGIRQAVPVSLASRPLNLALHGIVAFIAALGVIATMRERGRSFAWIAAAWTVVMLLVLPTRAARYLWPLHPLFALAFVAGVRWLVDRLAPRQAPSAAIAGIGMSALLAAGVAQSAASPAPQSYATLPDLADIRSTLKRIDNGAGNLRVVVFSPRVMTWEDGYTTMAQFEAPPDSMLAQLRSGHITHVVVGDAGAASLGARGVERLVAERPENFAEVMHNRSFRLLEIKTARADSVVLVH